MPLHWGGDRMSGLHPLAHTFPRIDKHLPIIYIYFADAKSLI